MQKLTGVVSTMVIGIVFCLGMTIYTGIQESRERNTPKPLTIPLPVLGGVQE